MVPGTAERDRSTSREQWNDWWRVNSPSAGRALRRVNAGALWTWRPALLLRPGVRQEKSRADGGWVGQVAGDEALTGY